jgi:hypothetical protein
LDSFAVPKPAYWRIVQGRPVYIDGYTPRVYGVGPGLTQLRRGVEALEVPCVVDGLDRQVGLAAGAGVGHASNRSAPHPMLCSPVGNLTAAAPLA